MVIKIKEIDILEQYWAEFNRRIMEDEDFAAKLPDGAVVFLLPESDPQACARVKEEAKQAARWMATRLVETNDDREYEIMELPGQKQTVVFVIVSADGQKWEVVPAEEVLDVDPGEAAAS